MSSPPPLPSSLSGARSVTSSLSRSSSGSPPSLYPRRKLRILILSSDTGGGHRASAQALCAAFLALQPDSVHVDIVDFWVELAAGPFAAFPNQYTYLAKRPWMWKASYELTRFPPARAVSEEFFNAFGNRKVRDAFIRYAPDLIVSVHPLVNTLSQKVLGEMEAVSGLPKVPYVTVVTDLGGAHPTWFHRRVDMTYIPSEGVRRVAERVGVSADKIKKLGLPVREDFWGETRGKEELREELGMRGDVPAVLAVGGGDGVGGLKAIAEALAYGLGNSLGPDAVQLVVVCGKNEKLRKELAERQFPLEMHAKGYVTNMSDWMGACDVICTKAGPGTIAEAMIRGLPMILTAFLPGQEEANVEYVVRERVGEYAREPWKIAETAQRWLAEPALLEGMAGRARACARPQASVEIAADVIEVAKQRIKENMETLTRQRRLRILGGRTQVGPHPQRLGAASAESHLVFRLKFLMRVACGAMIAKKAIRGSGASGSTMSSPPDSPRSM